MDKSLKIFNSKNYIFLYVTLMIGILIPTFFGSTASNVWLKFLNIISDEWFITAVIISILLIVEKIYNVYHNINVILRFSDLKSFIKNALKIITKNIIIYLIFAILISFVFSVIISNFDFSVYYYSYYEINLIIYELFFAIRLVVMVYFLSIIFYLFRINLGRVVSMIIFATIIILNLMYYQIPFFNNNITGFTSIPYVFISYFKIIDFSSFWLEICATLIQLLILVTIIIIMEFISTEKEQEDKLK